MPRGNDPDAQRELQERYGATTGNAESLIAANRARRNPQLRAAHLSALQADADAKVEEAVAKAREEASKDAQKQAEKSDKKSD
jgi:hypothetical protein